MSLSASGTGQVSYADVAGVNNTAASVPLRKRKPATSKCTKWTQMNHISSHSDGIKFLQLCVDGLYEKKQPVSELLSSLPNTTTTSKRSTLSSPSGKFKNQSRPGRSRATAVSVLPNASLLSAIERSPSYFQVVKASSKKCAVKDRFKDVLTSNCSTNDKKNEVRDLQPLAEADWPILGKVTNATPISLDSNFGRSYANYGNGECIQACFGSRTGPVGLMQESFFASAFADYSTRCWCCGTILSGHDLEFVYQKTSCRPINLTCTDCNPYNVSRQVADLKFNLKEAHPRKIGDSIFRKIYTSPSMGSIDDRVQALMNGGTEVVGNGGIRDDFSERRYMDARIPTQTDPFNSRMPYEQTGKTTQQQPSRKQFVYNPALSVGRESGSTDFISVADAAANDAARAINIENAERRIAEQEKKTFKQRIISLSHDRIALSLLAGVLTVSVFLLLRPTWIRKRGKNVTDVDRLNMKAILITGAVASLITLLAPQISDLIRSGKE